MYSIHNSQIGIYVSPADAWIYMNVFKKSSTLLKFTEHH